MLPVEVEPEVVDVELEGLGPVEDPQDRHRGSVSGGVDLGRGAGREGVPVARAVLVRDQLEGLAVADEDPTAGEVVAQPTGHRLGREWLGHDAASLRRTSADAGSGACVAWRVRPVRRITDRVGRAGHSPSPRRGVQAAGCPGRGQASPGRPAGGSLGELRPRRRVLALGGDRDGTQCSHAAPGRRTPRRQLRQRRAHVGGLPRGDPQRGRGTRVRRPPHRRRPPGLRPRPRPAPYGVAARAGLDDGAGRPRPAGVRLLEEPLGRARRRGAGPRPRSRQGAHPAPADGDRRRRRPAHRARDRDQAPDAVRRAGRAPARRGARGVRLGPAPTARCG